MPAAETVKFGDLTTPFKLTDQQIRSFRENGYVKLKHVLSPKHSNTTAMKLLARFLP